MSNFKLSLIILLASFLFGCEVLKKDSSKYNFADGYYYSKLNKKHKTKYYVITGGDSIKVYPSTVENHIADTIKSITVFFPARQRPSQFTSYTFETQDIDLDVLTILFKLRPSVKHFPQQFNTNFNGAVYGGYRKDMYKLSYTQNPLKIQNRNVSHTGYSFGAFAGIGSARIDEFVTLNRINYEYDGLIVTGGVAVILGFNKLNFGLNVGLDYLTDKNRDSWVNQRKPWIGVSIGLNLN